MKHVFVALTVALLGVTVSACGSATKRHVSEGGLTARSPQAGSEGVVTQDALRAMSAVTAKEGKRWHYPQDPDEDTGERRGSGYRDPDDAHIFAHYGRPASAGDTRAVTAVVLRYYALAEAGQAHKACSMLVPSVKKAAVLDHGRFGPAYLHRARTCAEVVSGLFRHSRRELAAPISVTGVLVKGSNAYALLGSRKMQASFIAVLRVNDSWRLEALLGSPII